MRKRLISLAVTIILSIVSSSAFAQSSQISNGLTWLYSAQTSSGNWPAVATTDYYSTVAALDAVYALDPVSPTYTSAVQWMSGQIVSPIDYLSRQIITLARASRDTSGYMSREL
jgi:squalene cyclase